MKEALVFEASREGYSIDQLRGVMTVGRLREILRNYDEDTLIVLSHDNGYTYGSIDEDEMSFYRQNDPEEDFEQIW